jgi:aflatoxin B1 aldehyde reductase
MYNVITRGIESELVPACRRYGLDIVVYNPIAGGLFSGKIKTKDLVPEDGRFSDKANVGSNYRKRYFRQSTFDAMKIIEDALAKHEGLTMIETALRWCVHHSALKIKDGGNDGIIIGVSSVAQLKDNLNQLEKGPLPEDVVEALQKAWEVSRADVTSYVHGDVVYSYDTKEAIFGDGAL